ncbi:MAG: zinc-dependent alcohol dehydrogenase [Acidimicrobiales bacterium]
MRAGLVTGKQRFELAEVDDPAPGVGQVVIAVARCGICGSDVHAYRDGWPYSPGICGHEWTGKVVALGADVPPRLASEGLRVVGGQAPGCGRCLECRADLPRFCRLAASRYSGRQAPKSGGFAPFITLDADRLVPVPESVDDERAALIEPASVAMHAIRKSRLAVGDVACVVGCGPIGLMALQCARLAGAGTVIAVEPNPDRQALALTLGADVAVAPGDELRQAVNDASGGLRADIAFDCAGIPQTLQQSVDMVRKAGSVCMVGVSGETATIEPMRWMMKEVSVDTSILFTLDEMAICAQLIADGRLATDGFVAETVQLDDLGSTIDGMAGGDLGAVKILVDPSAG